MLLIFQLTIAYMKKNLFRAFLATLPFLWACNNDTTATTTDTTSTTESASPARSKAFELTVDGKETHLYFLKNKKNATAELTNYGARLVSLMVPDKNGSLVDVVLGHDSVSRYRRPGESFFGTTIGRYGNRIAKGKFKLDGKEYTLDINNAPNSLHGGKDGFNTKVWDATQKDSQSISFSYVS